MEFELEGHVYPLTEFAFHAEDEENGGFDCTEKGPYISVFRCRDDPKINCLYIQNSDRRRMLNTLKGHVGPVHIQILYQTGIVVYVRDNEFHVETFDVDV